MKTLLLILCLIYGCTSKPSPVPAGPTVSITEISPNKWTAFTRQNLEHLLQVYYLTPVLFTKKIQIQTGVLARPKPVLTLNTRFSEYPHKILATFIHEQFYWWMDLHRPDVAKALLDLKKMYPKSLPASRLNILVSFLEYEALIHYLEKKEANNILRDFISKDKKDPWTYTQVYTKYKSIDGIIQRNNLRPAFLKPVNMTSPPKGTKKS